MVAHARPPARAADVPTPLQLLPRAGQLPLPLEAGPAPAPVLTYSVGGPDRAATVSIRPEPGGGWRVSYGLAADMLEGGGCVTEASAILAPTYPAALAAAHFARALLNGALRLHVRTVAPAMLEAVRQLQQQPAPPAPPADDPAPTGRRGRVVPFRARPDALAPTG